MTVLFSSDPGNSGRVAYYVGPFPTDALLVPDPTTNTGQRVNLPTGNDSCTIQPAAVCGNSSLLNEINGFSVNPRSMVCFSGQIEDATLPNGIHFYPIDAKGNLRSDQPIAIDRTIVDPLTNCAYAKPAQLLNQNSRYALLVTSAVLDTTKSYASVQPDPAFTSCKAAAGSPGYCGELGRIVGQWNDRTHSVVSASVFSTMSVTDWMQQTHSVVDALPVADIVAGYPSSFAWSSVSQLTYTPADSGLPPQSIPISVLSNIGTVSFGIFLSPLYLNTSGMGAGTITTSPLQPTGFVPVSYHVFLPSVTHGKIPVVIYGHGTGDTQFGASTYAAATFAKNGFATLSFELTGHGYGLASTVAVTLTDGTTAYEFTPGRGVSISGGAIGATDGCIVPGPFAIRDCVRQSAVDVFSLVQAIRATGGLGLNLDPNRIFYVGQSLGAIIGTLATAVEPNLTAVALSGDGGSFVDIARLSPTSRLLATGYLASLGNGELLNVTAGLAQPEPYFKDAFNDSFPFSGQAPFDNTVGGAMNIQAAFESADWIGVVGDALAFAPYLNPRQLLNHGPATPALFQFGIGDLEVPNPTESSLVQAAGAQTNTSVFRFDEAAAWEPGLLSLEDPAVPGLAILPHRAFSNPTIFASQDQDELSIALTLQQQAADFFASKGKQLSNPDGYFTGVTSELGLPPASSSFFVNAPATLPLNLNFLQIQP